MKEVFQWVDGSTISAERARRALPILVRQARAERPITYLDLSRELGMSHHRPVRYAAGHVGYALQALARQPGWKRRPPPPLQSLVVNKGTGLPGSGVNEFMGRAFRQAQTRRQREAALNGVYAQIYSYPHWEELLELLEIDPAPAALDDEVEEATRAGGRGGEGPEHKALKDYVSATPALLSLPAGHKPGRKEFPLPSGDSVDVVFEGRGLKTAVEVKSHISSDGDVARGLFQCLKYRTVLEAQSAISATKFEVVVRLVLGKAFPPKLIALRNSLGITVIDNVVPGP